MWNTESDSFRDDKLSLYMYFQEYAKNKVKVTDEALAEILETVYTVTLPGNRDN